MALPREARSPLLLVATFGVGWLAVLSRPEQVLGSEMWPAGLAAAAVFTVSARLAPVMVLAVGMTAAATFVLGGRPAEYATIAGVAVAVEAGLAAWILSQGWTRPPALRDDDDLRRLLAAVGAGGVVVGVVLGVATGLLSDRDPLLTGIGTAVGHMSSALVLLPFIVATDRRGSGSGTERVIRWLLLVGITCLVFYPSDFPSLMFAVLPILGWTAMRSPLVEAQLQLLVLTIIGTVLTTFGFGPLAEVAGRYALPEVVLGLVLQTYLLTCALIVIPLSLARGQQVRAVDRAEAESALLRRIIDSAHVAIIGTDEIGRITLFNPGAERLLGYRAEEVTGEFTTIFHSDAAITEKAAELGVPDDYTHVALRLAEPGQDAQQMRFLRKDGEERTHSMTLSRVLDPTGRVTGYVATSEDVTEELETRQALLDALEAERTAVQGLREVDQVKDSFVSSVSHELRTPITSIVGYLEMLLDGEFGPLTREQHTAIRRVDANSRRLLSLIDELLTLSRMGEHGAGRTEVVDLCEVARTAYNVVTPGLAQRSLASDLVLPDRPVLVHANAELLERVVLNLLGNAVKFTPDSGAVSLWLQVIGEEAVLSVRDTGIGIPLDEQPHLFSRFFRSTLAQRHAIQGTGLGLSIALSVVEAHEGRIEVASAPGVGTTFRVWLPLHDARNHQTAPDVVLGGA